MYMPKGQHLPIHVCQEILLKFDAYRREGQSIMGAITQISEENKLAPKTIHALLKRLQPTTDLAKMYLKAKAYRMARRLARKASPAEIIDILERPGINVLEPAKKMESGGGGFFLSVQTDSCGAVKMGIASGQAVAALAPTVTPDFNPFVGLSQEDFDEEPTPRDAGPRIEPPNQRQALAIRQAESQNRTLEEARAKLAQARAATHALSSQE